MSDETRRAVVRALAGLVKPGVPADDRRLTFAVQLYELHGKEGGQEVHDWLLALADAPEHLAGEPGQPSVADLIEAAVEAMMSSRAWGIQEFAEAWRAGPVRAKILSRWPDALAAWESAS